MIFTLSNSLHNYCGIDSKLHAKHASFHAKTSKVKPLNHASGMAETGKRFYVEL